MRARLSTPSTSAGVLAAAYALRIGTRVDEVEVLDDGDATRLAAVLEPRAVPVVASEPLADAASSSEAEMPKLAASEVCAVLLVGMELPLVLLITRMEDWPPVAAAAAPP